MVCLKCLLNLLLSILPNRTNNNNTNYFMENIIWCFECKYLHILLVGNYTVMAGWEVRERESVCGKGMGQTRRLSTAPSGALGVSLSSHKAACGLHSELTVGKHSLAPLPSPGGKPQHCSRAA